MILSPAQLCAVSVEEHTLIVACPGSGKTRTLVAKMLRCLDEVRDTPYKIACLTYTTAAVHEIEYRLWRYGQSGDEKFCDISTIHSFCLANILDFFYEYIPEYENGFSVLSSDSEAYKEIVKETLDIFNLDRRLVNTFENLNREPDGGPSYLPDIGPEVVIQFWERLRKDGLIDFPSMIYYAYKILFDHPNVAHALAAKYKWILVDEFQDTSALQVEIFRAIAQFDKTKFFLVGDPIQSIYGFAGAVPGLLDEFAEELGAIDDFQLRGNFRCSDQIVEHAERLCPRTPPMTAIGQAAATGIEPVYVDTTSSIEAIVEHFLPVLEEYQISYGEAAILAPWWFTLYPLARHLREQRIPVVGPGARPYKRSHPFAMFAEALCASLVKNSPKAFHQLEKELFLLLRNLNRQRAFTLYSYEGKLLALQLLRIAQEVKEQQQGAIRWLSQCAYEIGDALVQEQIISEETAMLIGESADHMIADMIRNKINTHTLSIEDLGIFADTANSIKLLTMHRAKGREFDAVAIIDLLDGKVPDYRAIKNNDVDRIEEGRRLLYVGITRARRFLLYAADSNDWRGPSRFLGDSGLALI